MSLSYCRTPTLSKLRASFGNPVTISLGASGFLYKVNIANAQLVYKLPNSVTLTGNANFDLGLLSFTGNIGVAVDPKANLHAGNVRAAGYFNLDKDHKIKIGGFTVAFNNRGFAAHIGFPGLPDPIPPFIPIIGTFTYTWGANGGPGFYYGQDMTGPFVTAIPAQRRPRGGRGRLVQRPAWRAERQPRRQGPGRRSDRDADRARRPADHA